MCARCRADLKCQQIYGISLEQRDSILASQGGHCAICEQPIFRPQIDHDHMTGKIRGILCPLCNKGLGLFKDSLASLKNAIRYLDKNSGELPDFLVASSG